MTTEQLEAMQAIQDAYLEMKLTEEQVSADRKGRKIPARRLYDKDSKDYEKTDESVDESARADKKKSISSMLDRMYARADANTKLYKLKQQNKDRKKLPEEVELGESVNHATFIKKYKENEDDNQHSKNVVHLARHFGSDEDKTEAHSILTAHNKAGHLTSEVGKRRDALHKKLWSPVIDRAYNKSTNEEVESLDELSRKGLSNYISAAKDDTKERSAGIKLAQKKKWGDPKFGTTSAKVPANEEVDEAFDPEKFKAAMDKTNVKVNMDSKADREVAAKEKSDARHAEIDASNKRKSSAWETARAKLKNKLKPFDQEAFNKSGGHTGIDPFGGSNAKYAREEVESLEESRYGDEDDDVRRAENELKRRNIKLPNVKHKEVAIKKTKKDKEEELGEASVFDQARKTVADDEKKGVDPKEKFKLMMTKAKNSQRAAKALAKESLDEARAKKEPMEVFHTGYSAALQHAEKHLNKQGYEIHPDDWQDHISFGPSKPSEGKTVQLHVPLHKDGVKSKKVAHIQVYNRGNTTPKNNELNMYVN